MKAKQGKEPLLEPSLKDSELRYRRLFEAAQDALIESESTLREQSVRDHLTGLFNRRYMEETLERELLRASPKGYPWA